VAGYNAGGFDGFRKILPELVPKHLVEHIRQKGCAVDLARFSMTVPARNQTCTKCTSCRIGIAQALSILDDIAAGRATLEMLHLLEELVDTIQTASDCPVGKSAPGMLQFTLTHFRDQFEAHIDNKACPAGICQAHTYYAQTCCLKEEKQAERGGDAS
jgi:NADH:ubiquinone oxidoreductase subunit F (NADH-binding)